MAGERGTEVGREGGREREGVDGGEEEGVRRSSFKGTSRTVDEKWRAGKAECQLAGSTVKNGCFERGSYFSIKARRKKNWDENFTSVTLESFNQRLFRGAK